MILSDYIDNIVNIIELNEQLIIYDFNSKKDQILLPKELVDKLNFYISSLEELGDAGKGLLNLALKEAFELSKHDLILSKKGHILLKLIDKSKIKEVADKDKETIANRYAGIDEAELESFYEDFMADSEHKQFFSSVAKEFVNKYFIEQEITNVAYEKNVFAYIQAITFEHLIIMYDNSDGFFNGFAGYIFRIHFKEVFEHIADIMLDEISMANSSVIEFLNYYSSDIIVMNGNKYQVPSIEAKDGLRWNVVSMLSIAKIFTKAKRSIEILKQEIKILKVDVEKLYIGGLSPLEYQNRHIKARQSVESKIARVNLKLEKYLDSLSLLENELDIKTLEIQILDIKRELEVVRVKKEDLLTRTIQKSVLSEYSKLQNVMDSKSRTLLREQKIVTQNINQYLHIRESLVKALIAKKKRV